MTRQSPEPGHAALEAIEVSAPARLHLGFLDLNGGLGRRFGSIGLAVEGIGTRLTLGRGKPSTHLPERAARTLATVMDRLELEGPFRLILHETIPEHVGLGSGTQLGLAIGAGLSTLVGTPRSARALAPLVERGARSGIGIGAFDLGGFLVDGGKSGGAAAPPIIARAEFPPSWRLILIFDPERRGLSGEKESAAFAALPTFPETLAAHLCHLTLMRLLPGICERDFASVAESIGEIQAHVGDHFAPAQGGRFSSPRVAAALEWLRGRGFAGIGQSSWGPTGFVLVENAEHAKALRQELARRFSPSLSFRLCAGRNRGADIGRTT
jgi:beta-ribofuranosylaminobenzene 5'-phosphate synthase